MQIFIDHLTIAGPNLDDLRGRLAAAGISTDYGGVHNNGITHMALAGFDDGSYLEIAAPLSADGRVALWRDFQLPREGGVAWTIATDDVASELMRVRNLGIEATGPVVVRRERPDNRIGQWQLGYLESHQPGGVLPFIIHDDTDRGLRVRPTTGLKGALAGWTAIVLAVRDSESAARQFQHLYGWDSPVCSGELLHFVGTPVYLSCPKDHLVEFGESPCACVLGTKSAAFLTDFRFSATSSLASRTVRWLDLPWKNIRIGLEEPQ
jgi:hypothetical protein